MNEKDIRIGNSLLLYGEVVKVTEIGFRIDDYYLRVERNKNGYYLDQFKPIELTEEILLNCGFEKREDGDYNLFKYSEVDIVICSDFSSWKCDGINFSVNYIKHLHQLQNLYWSLCRKELEIEL